MPRQTTFALFGPRQIGRSARTDSPTANLGADILECENVGAQKPA